jgi:phosphoribosylformylglycinamidine synthase
VTLQPRSRLCIWTQRLPEPISCPVAHGGYFVLEDNRMALQQREQVALVYARPDGSPAGQNTLTTPPLIGWGSRVCNAQGNVLGLMPHPENHIYLPAPPMEPGSAAPAAPVQKRRGVCGNKRCLHNR